MQDATILRWFGVDVMRCGEAAGLGTVAGPGGSGLPMPVGSARDLTRAIRQGELCLHYQPKVEPGSGTLVGAEALVRWLHPEEGFMLPGRFVSMAETSGQIVQLGHWVLNAACAQMLDWRERDISIPGISVNVSALELDTPGYVDRLQEVLDRTGLPAEVLTLEITESSAIDGPVRPKCLHALAKLGVRISLDDFGTGYGSLLHLRHLPVSEMKIDRSFVAGLMHDRQDTAIVEALVGLGRSAGIVCVAEGVESLEQQKALSDLSCDQIQGYVISTPVPPLQLEQLAAARACESCWAIEH